MVIIRSDFEIHSDRGAAFNPAFLNSLSDVFIPSPIPSSKNISAPVLINAESVSEWIGDL